MLHIVESLIADLEPVERHEAQTFASPTTHNEEFRGWAHRRKVPAAPSAARPDVSFVHRFDTDRRDLEQSGHVLALHERNGTYFVVASGLKGDWRTDGSSPTEVQIDRAWAVEILADAMSPLTALERRLGRADPAVVEEIRSIAGGRKLRRADTHLGRSSGFLNASGSGWVNVPDNRSLHSSRLRR